MSTKINFITNNLSSLLSSNYCLNWIIMIKYISEVRIKKLNLNFLKEFQLMKQINYYSHIISTKEKLYLFNNKFNFINFLN